MPQIESFSEKKLRQAALQNTKPRKCTFCDGVCVCVIILYIVRRGRRQAEILYEVAQIEIITTPEHRQLVVSERKTFSQPSSELIQLK